jgi:hypothetical protein
MSEEPEWLTKAVASLSDPLGLSEMSVRNLADHVQRNAQGFVTPGYNIETDVSGWVFGSARFDKLVDPKRDGYFLDDPFAQRRDEIALDEFLIYLQAWYWPRKKQMRDTV